MTLVSLPSTPTMRGLLRAALPRIVAPYARRCRLALPSHTTSISPSCQLVGHRAFASVTDVKSLPVAGEKFQGFTLRGVKHVSELELTALHFRHDKTDAEYLHIARDDNNNAFSIGFKTNPPNATGVPHILEHVTLCGSEKYPIRDPFFKMLPRSLNNFMNAFTTTDHTMYPISTTNKTDFCNLMTMYIDATLHPLLKQSDFRQEGWRIGPEDPHAESEDEGGELGFKGVVYNEMKGQFSDHSYLYYMRWLQEVFPSLNFYGGDPQAITDLTWQDLSKFHRDHYHPSNSKIITYGNTPFMEHLSILGPELDRFTKRTDLDSDLKLPMEMRDSSREATMLGPVDTMLPADAQNKISITWLMSQTKDLQETFALRVATTLLLDGYGSPMYQALVESALGTDYTANTGFDTSSAQGIFAVGVNGVSHSRLRDCEAAIHNTVKKTIEEGFDPRKVEGVLHQLEIGLKHKSASFGLDIINNLTPGWFNGIDPLEALSWNAVVDAFKQRYQEKGYLESLLKKYLLPDRCFTFIMLPSNDYAAKLAAGEAMRLQKKIEDAGIAARQTFRDQELSLLREQETGSTESLACLPTLTVNDIPRQQAVIDTDCSQLPTSSLHKVKVQWRETNTNGLTYLRAIALMALDDNLRPLMPLFCGALTRLGTKNRSFAEIEDQIKLKTGGINISYHSNNSPNDIQVVEEGVAVSSSALDANVHDMIELLHTLLVEADFSSLRARTLIRQLLQASASGAMDSVAESGHAEARRYAEASLTPHGSMIEQTSGLTQVEVVSRLAQLDEQSQEMDLLVNHLAQIQQKTIEALLSRTRIAITCSHRSRGKVESELTQFLSKLEPSADDQQKGGLLKSLRTARSGQTFFDVPFQVFYTGLSMRAFPYTDPRGASLAVLAQLLSHKHLHHEVREKGGAYGAGAYSRGLGGIWGMFSYRDPNPENTVKIMQQVGKWAAERSWSAEDLQEAKLSLFQSIDAPLSVNDEGMLEFVSGIDARMEQQRREWLLDVDASQVRTAAEWVAEQLSAKQENTVILGDKAKFAADGWNVELLKRS